MSIFIPVSLFFALVLCTITSDVVQMWHDEWMRWMNWGAKVMEVFIDKDQLAATFTASAFTLIGQRHVM